MGEEVNPAASQITMLHIFPSFGFGGQQARFAELVKGLGDEFTHRVVVLDGDLSAKSLVPTHANVSFQEFPFRKSRLASVLNFWRFRRLLKDTRPDLLCTYNWGSIEAALVNKWTSKIPHLHFEDGFGADETPEHQLPRRVKARRMALSGSTIVVPSRTLEKVAREIWNFNADQVLRIENGVDFNRFQQTSTRVRRRVAVGAIGALRPEKNYPRLIKAFERADLGKKSKLTIYGDGPDKPRIAEAIAKGSANDRVDLAGATTDSADCYKDFDIFALSSDTEQAPLTLMEAMAAGLPVIATNVGDISSMVSEANRAFVTPLGDEIAYELALAHLLQNPDARAALGAANRKKAKEAFNLDRMIERHRALYLSKLGRS